MHRLVSCPHNIGASAPNVKQLLRPRQLGEGNTRANTIGSAFQVPLERLRGGDIGAGAM